MNFIGKLLITALGFIIAKRIYDSRQGMRGGNPLITMVQLMGYAERYLTEHPEENNISFALCSRHELLPKIGPQAIAPDAQYVIVVGPVKDDQSGLKHIVTVFVGGDLELSVKEALSRDALIITR